MVKLLATNRTKTWWNPLVEMCWRRGKFLPTTKKRKTFPRPFSTVERKHCEVQQFQGSWCPGGSGGGGRRFLDHRGLAGSIWILVFVWGNENDGKTFFAPIFCFRKKHLNLSILFSGRLFLGVFGWLWEGFYPWNALSRCIFLVQIFIDTFCRRTRPPGWPETSFTSDFWSFGGRKISLANWAKKCTFR